MCLRIGKYNSEWEISWEEDKHSDLPKQEDIDFFEKVVKAKAVFKVSTKEKGLQLINYNELLALKGDFRWKWIGVYDQDFERTYLNMSDLKWKDINY